MFFLNVLIADLEEAAQPAREADLAPLGGLRACR